MSVWPSETIVMPLHPAVTFTQSDRLCTHPEPPPLPTAMVRAHSHRYLFGALAREPTMPTRYRRMSNADAERNYCGYAHERRQISRARTTRPDVATATVAITATVTATIVVNRVSCNNRCRDAEPPNSECRRRTT